MKKNYFYNLLLTVFNLVIPVISFPYAARVLGPAGVGKAQFIITLSQYVALLAALGIPIYGVREIARAKHSRELLSKTFRELVLINLITGLIFFLGYSAMIARHPFFKADARLFSFAGIIILLSFTSIEWLFSGLEQFRQIATRSIIIKALSMALIFIFINRPTDIPYYVAISLIAILANNLVNVWMAAGLLKGKTPPLQLTKHLRPLVFLLGTTVASTLYTTFDSIILGFVSGNKAVGLYVAATRVTKIAIPVVMAYGAVLLPEITRDFQAGNTLAVKENLNRSYAYIVMLSVPVCTGLYVFAPSLMALFSGRGFLEGIITMRIMAFLPLLIGLGYFWGYQVILPFGKDKFLLMAALAGMATSLTLNFLLVPLLRQNGAAIANVASEIIVTAGYFLLIRSHLKVTVRHRYLFEAAISSLPFLVFLFLDNNFLLHNQTITMLACGGSAILLYGVIQVFVFRNKVLTGLLAKYRLIQPKFHLNER